MKRNQNRTGTKEEQGFEEGMGKQMKHGGFAGSEPHRHDHVAELGKSGIGQNAFDVVLLRRDQRGHHGGDGADPSNDTESKGRSLHEKTDSHQHAR